MPERSPRTELIAALEACELEREQVVRGHNGRAALSQKQVVALADEITRLKASVSALGGTPAWAAPLEGVPGA